MRRAAYSIDRSGDSGPTRTFVLRPPPRFISVSPDNTDRRHPPTANELVCLSHYYPFGNGPYIIDALSKQSMLNVKNDMLIIRRPKIAMLLFLYLFD